MSNQNKEEAFSDGFDAGQNEALSFIAEKDAEIAYLKAELERRTSERDYHLRMADMLADRTREVDDRRAHKVMMPEEYEAMPLNGWHEVCRDVDGCGGVGIRFLGDIR